MAFIAANDEVKHVDFMTEAWVNDPLKVVLRRIAGFSRPAGCPSGRDAEEEIGPLRQPENRVGLNHRLSLMEIFACADPALTRNARKTFGYDRMPIVNEFAE